MEKEDALKQAKKKEEELEKETEQLSKTVNAIANKLGISKDEMENLLSEEKVAPADEKIKTIVYEESGIYDAEPPFFEKVPRDTDAEHKPTPDLESRKSLAELEAELEKARLDYFKKSEEQHKIKILSKQLLQKITRGSFNFKPDFVEAKTKYEASKDEFIKTKYSEKAIDLERDIFKAEEEKERELADYKADILTEESARMSKMLDARTESLSDKRKALREKALKATLPAWNAVKGTYKTVVAVDKKIFHRGPVLIDKRGAKPADATALLAQAKLNDDQIETLKASLKNEKDSKEKGRLKKEIATLKETSEDLKDRAKGEVIYQYRLGQLARSTILFGVGGGAITTGAGAAMLGARVLRGVVIGFGGAVALAKNEQGLQSKLHEIETAREKLENVFAGHTGEKAYKVGILRLEKQERKHKMLRNGMKGVIVALMATANIASGTGKVAGIDTHIGQNWDNSIQKGLGNIFSDGDTVEEVKPLGTQNPSPTEKNDENSADTQTDENKESSTSSAEGTVTTPEAKVTTLNIDVKGEGAFATVAELKAKLAEQFGANPTSAPENVQHILNTNTAELTKEWGMFNPDNAEESAMMLGGSTITVDENGNVTLHNVGKGDTVLSGVGAKVYDGQMFDSDNQTGGGNGEGVGEGAIKLTDGEVDINQVPEGEGDYTKLTEDGVDINQNPEGLDPNNPDKAPYTDGLPVDKEDLNKTVWEKNHIKIRSGAYEDASGNIIRLEGKDVTLGADHKIYVDGIVSEELTDKLDLEKGKLLDKTFTTMFGWSNDGTKSPEWLRLQNYNMDTLKNPPTEGFLNDKESNFIKKLLKQASRNGIDYRGKTASQLVEAIAIKKLG